MAIVAWSDNYNVDIQEIDEQHKCLVSYVNELYDALTQKRDRKVIGDVVIKLVEYTKVHFAIEETLMRLFDYSDYQAHKAGHDKIAERVIAYQKRFQEGDEKVGMELLLFLKGWLSEHIQYEDKKYAEILHAAGVKKKWLKKFW